MVMMAMAVIMAQIQFYGGASDILDDMISAAFFAAFAMDNLKSAMADVDPGPFENMRTEIDKNVVALNELERELPKLNAQGINALQVRAPQIDLPEESSVINGDVISVPQRSVAPIPQEIRPDVAPNAPPGIALIEGPVAPSVEWKTESLEVFTNTGFERFQQEVQSADAMLQQLYDSQKAVAKQAQEASSSMVSSEMIADLNSITDRINKIRERIQLMESNPINVGSDKANAALEQMRIQLSQAVKTQNQLSTAVNDMDMGAANEAYLSLSQTVAGTERYIRDNLDKQGRFNDKVGQGINAAEGLQKAFSKAAESLLSMSNVKKVAEWVGDCMKAFDAQRHTEMRLMGALANNLDADYASQYGQGPEAETQALQSAYSTISNKASEIQGRGIYTDDAMIAGAAELSADFSDPVAIEMMMDTLADFAMGASGGGEVNSAAMQQYAASLGKVMSGSYDGMAEKGFSFTEAQKAVIAGTATQEQVIAAIGEEYLSASQDVQAAAAIAASVQQTWGGLYDSMSNTPEGQIMQMTNAWGSMQEEVGGQLYPFVLLFVETITGNWGIIQTVLNAIVTGLQFIMGILSWLLEGAMGFAQVIVDNWSWISPIIYGIVAALAVYGAYLAITKGIEIASAVASGIVTVGKGLLAAATMLLTGATWAQAAAQVGLNGAMAACPIVWIIALIIALIAIIFAVCSAIAKLTGIADSGFGVICGSLNVANEFFKNLFMTIGNVLLGIGNAINALASNLMTAFRNAICSVQSWFYNLLSTALTVVEKICEALNKLPFVEFDYSGIGDAADYYAQKAAEAEEKKGEYKDVAEAFKEGFSTFDAFQDGWSSDAFEAGAAWGDGIADKFSNFSLADFFGAEEIPPAEDYGDQYGLKDPEKNSGLSDNVADIAENTGNINGSLECTQEDLKYLRDIAEQDAVNRFTIAEIKVEQTNHNNINSKLDLDGVVSGLTNAVNESIDSVTEGVHE